MTDEPTVADLLVKNAEMQKKLDEQASIISGYEAKAKEFEDGIKAKDAEIAKLNKYLVSSLYSKESSKEESGKTESEEYADLLKSMKKE